MRIDHGDRRLGGQHLGQRGVRPSVHEPEALPHAVGDREAALDGVLAHRDHLEAEHPVERVGLGDDVGLRHVGHADRALYGQRITSSPGAVS